MEEPTLPHDPSGCSSDPIWPTYRFLRLSQWLPLSYSWVFTTTLFQCGPQLQHFLSRLLGIGHTNLSVLQAIC